MSGLIAVVFCAGVVFGLLFAVLWFWFVDGGS